MASKPGNRPEKWVCESCGREMSGAYTVEIPSGKSRPVDICIACRVATPIAELPMCDCGQELEVCCDCELS